MISVLTAQAGAILIKHIGQIFRIWVPLTANFYDMVSSNQKLTSSGIPLYLFSHLKKKKKAGPRPSQSS